MWLRRLLRAAGTASWAPGAARLAVGASAVYAVLLWDEGMDRLVHSLLVPGRCRSLRADHCCVCAALRRHALPGVGSITDAWLTSPQASTSRALEADGALPRAVDDEAGHVGPRVMADDIEVLPLLAHDPMVERNDVHLLFRGRRLEEPVAVRSSHRRPACREPFGRPREELVPKGDSGRHVGCTEHAGHGDDERPASPFGT